MQLVIVESPAKTKTISKYLGKDFKVEASVGHVRDLPKSNKNAIDIEGGFVPNYEVVKGKEKIIKTIKDLSKKADSVILATDPDREGEAIAWHIKEEVGIKNPKRIVFNEITKDAVEEALANPRDIDENLKEAQEARRVLDRLIGYGLSGLIWKKVRYGLSAGRVQSPALRIIMEREKEIRRFMPEDFFTITAEVENDKKESFEIISSVEPKEEKEVKRIIKEAKSGKWRVSDIKEQETKRQPKPPFTTSTLQQAASSRLGLSPLNTMRIAQKLYEAGFITYMRTDSLALSKSAKDSIKQTVEKEFGTEFVKERAYKTKSKGAQEAHEAIRPTNPKKAGLGKNEQEKKLYRLIRERTLGSQMQDAKILKTKIIANIERGSIPDFHANGSRILFDGWFKADPRSKGEETELPKVKGGDPLKLNNIESEAKQTKPPSRYTEAGLVKELEKRGIGRPSTYATIMRTLSERGYMEKEGKTLFPTDRGEVVEGFVEDNFPNYVSDEFTAEMENTLDGIAEGKAKYGKTLSDYYTPFIKKVESKKDIPKVTNMGDVPEEFKCPECGGPMVYKLGKIEKFMSCVRFPECAGARTKEGEVLEGDKKTGEACPECGEELVEKSGRYGKFISCTNYPKCKYTKDGGEDGVNSTGVKCPKCEKGEMIEKRGRFGPFFACSNYPECKNTMKARPTGEKCAECGELMMEGTKTIPERCSDKNCSNHNPHKKENK